MADAISDAALGLTVQTVTAFLDAAQAKTECPICGFNGWEMIEPATLGTGNLSVAKGPNSISQRVVTQVLLTCGRCAFVRGHSARKIAEWSLKNRPASSL